MESLNLLVVCTGNICRSALAEYYLKHSLDTAHFAVASAGTQAVKNGRAPEPQVAIARRLGLSNITEHVAQQLSPKHVSWADLILTATLDHRRSVVQMAPPAIKKTFTIREFARLCPHVREQDIVEFLTEGVPSAAIPAAATRQLRGLVPLPKEATDDDVVDPFGTDVATYETAADQLISALQIIVPYLEKVTFAAKHFADTRRDATGTSEEDGTGAAADSGLPEALLKISFPTAARSHPSGKHSYNPIDAEQSRIREQMVRRMRQQRLPDAGGTATRRRKR